MAEKIILEHAGKDVYQDEIAIGDKYRQKVSKSAHCGCPKNT
jgi:hypothetical protein